MRILLIEDDEKVARAVSTGLQAEHFAVDHAGDGLTGLDTARLGPYDLIILDLMLPGLSGTELLTRLRKVNSDVPILILTARDAVSDKIANFEAGADDYLTKPFSPRELLLRIKKILARGQNGEKPHDQMRFGDLLIDLPRHVASWKGKTIELTATEFKLLVVLAQRAGRVQSRDHLLRDVWEYDSLIDTRTVDTHMRRLREKLGPASKHLDTVRGVGYRFVE